jgi:hypothetical protein
MADDHYIPAAGLPSEEENGGGDIEQGRIDISENTNGQSSFSSAAISGGALTPNPSTATTWIGDLEHVDEEDVAPVPLIQQIADMDVGTKKDDH